MNNSEYPANLIVPGEQIKYSAHYREVTNMALIEPELHRLFPNSGAVNRTLRKYAEEHDIELALQTCWAEDFLATQHFAAFVGLR